LLRLTLVIEDNPLYANEQQTVLNMVVETPRWTNGRMEANSPFSAFMHTPLAGKLG
jgi:inorganic pyrophosphatase